MEIKHKIDQIAMKYFEGNNVMFANRLKTSETNIRNYRTGKSQPKLDFVAGLSKELGISFDWIFADGEEMVRDQSGNTTDQVNTFLLKGDRKLENQRVALYNTNAAAGLTQTFSDAPNVIDYISIPNLPKCDGAIYITGDSMYPLLKSGDIVAYKRIKDIINGILWGEMYIVSFLIDDEEYTLVKYIQKSDLGEDFVKLVSQNQHHQSKDIPLKNVRAIAIVKASIRFNSMN